MPSENELLTKQPDFSKDDDFDAAKTVKKIDFSKFGQEAKEAEKKTKHQNQ